jgi:hypothetical protein
VEYPAPALRNYHPAALPLFLLMTVGIYFVYWVYRSYRYLAANAQGASRTTPVRAALFTLVPVLNIAWLVRIYIDLPRTVDVLGSWAQKDNGLPRWKLISRLLIGGTFLSAALILHLAVALIAATFVL